MYSCPFSEFGRFWEDNGGESGRAADCRGFRWANTISGMMAICLGGKKKRKTGQEVNDIINLNISAACRISFVWSCLFVLITSLYGLVSKKKHGNYLQCGTESIPTQADDCGPGGLSSQESQPYLTTTYSTIPHHIYHIMPCPITPCNITLYKDQGASDSHTLFLLTRRVSLLAVSFMCHLLICSPLKYPSLLV